MHCLVAANIAGLISAHVILYQPFYCDRFTHIGSHPAGPDIHLDHAGTVTQIECVRVGDAVNGALYSNHATHLQ